MPTVPDVDEFVIVNDGSPYPDNIYDKRAHVIQHKHNTCVGVSKNDALRYLISKDCDHLFLIEDDVLIKRPDVFEAYINAAKTSGIWHLNYALQGPANRKQVNRINNVNERQDLQQDSEPNPREIIEYDNGVKIALYPNIVGSFSYYLKGIIKNVGYMDERFKNAWEHVLHTQQVISKGLHPPFWWFADIANSYDYLTDIPGCIQDSTIAHTPDWNKNFQTGMMMYKQMYGWIPQQTPDTPPHIVKQKIIELEKKYSRKE
jgi:hypothetical protein